MLELCCMYLDLLRASVEWVKCVTQNNIQYSRQTSIREITKKNENILFSIKTQKRVDSTVDESVLKTTSYTKQ